MKRLITILLTVLVATASVWAQKRTTMPTVYKGYKPSVVTFADGHSSRQSLTNVFLKNSSLLFLRGEYAMEADMTNIVRVDFDDRSYVAINQKLGYVVDSVASNVLYCIELFDKDAYERNLKNNVNISSLDLGEQISMTTVDLNNDEDYKFPVFRHFYYLFNGEFVKVHERDLSKKLTKEGRTMMKRIIALPDFSWQNEKSLMELLKAISN